MTAGGRCVRQAGSTGTWGWRGWGTGARRGGGGRGGGGGPAGAGGGGGGVVLADGQFAGTGRGAGVGAAGGDWGKETGKRVCPWHPSARQRGAAEDRVGQP